MITFAIALVAAATAPEPKADPNPAPAAQTITLEARPAAKPGSQRMCASMPAMTGSHLSRRVCLTRDQWNARGANLPN
jgi:hypothetical protein